MGGWPTWPTPTLNLACLGKIAGTDGSRWLSKWFRIISHTVIEFLLCSLCSLVTQVPFLSFPKTVWFAPTAKRPPYSSLANPVHLTRDY